MNREPTRDQAEAIAALENAATPTDGKEIYEERYFPATLKRFAASAVPADVLILTVGTQPYSVALSLTNTPANKSVHFIHTDISEKSAHQALKLTGIPHDHARWHLVAPEDSTAVYRVVREAVEAYPGADLAIDFTSGTKAMTAGASTVAGYLRLRQIYIASSRLPGPYVCFGREAVHAVEHPLVVLGDIERAEAERAFDGGRFEVAERLFRSLDDARAPDYHFGARADLALAYSALDALRFEEASNRLTAVLEALDRVSKTMVSRETLLNSLGRLRRQQELATILRDCTTKDARPARDPGQSNVLLRFLLSTARRVARTRPDLSALLLYRSLELALQRRLGVHGLDAGEFAPPNPSELLERYNARCKPKFRLLELPSKVSLAQARLFLLALEDDAIASVDVREEVFEGMLTGRNSSIYAHGFRTLDADGMLPRFAAMVDRFVRAVADADSQPVPVNEDPEFDFLCFASLPATAAQ